MSELQRPFGIWTATALVVGGMIGAGIFALPGQLAPYGWAGTVSWLVAGLGVIAIARVIAALMAPRPQEPSILTICGDILGLAPGRVLTWTYWVTIFSSLPAISLTAAAYLLHPFPELRQGAWGQAAVALAIILGLAAVNLRGVRGAGRLQVATTLLKLVPLALVVAIVAWLLASAPETYSETTTAPFSAALLTPALAITFFAMLSFENASLVAERVKDPARNVPRATLYGLALVLTIYLVVSTGIAFAIPADELATTSAPVAYFVARYLGPWAGDAVALFAAISAIGCLNGLVMLLGELPLGLARDGQLPEWMAPTNARGVAARPLLLGIALGVVLLLGSVTGMGEKVLDFMLRLTTAASIWFYAGICLAALRTRTRIVAAVLGLAFCAWVLVSAGTEAVALSVLLIVIGIPLHFLIGKRSHAPLAADA